MGEAVIPVETEADSAWAYNSDYQKVFKQRKHTSRPHDVKWKPPDDNCVKVTYDDAMFDDIDEAAIGVVIRNAHGEVIASLAEKIQKPTSVIALELLAAKRAALFAQEIGLHHVVLEGDSEFVNNSLKFGTNLGSMHGHLIKDILFYGNSFQSISLDFTVSNFQYISYN